MLGRRRRSEVAITHAAAVDSRLRGLLRSGWAGQDLVLRRFRVFSCVVSSLLGRQKMHGALDDILAKPIQIETSSRPCQKVGSAKHM